MPDVDSPIPPPLEEEPDAARPMRLWPVVLVASFVGYPLSPGPVLWLCENVFGKGIYEYIRIVHIPLIFLYEHVPAVHTFYDWYFRQFGVR